MDDELGAAGFVEEALHRHRLARRQQAKADQHFRAVLDDLQRGGQIDADFVRQPACRRVVAFAGDAFADLGTQPRDAMRELIGAAWRLAQPERDRGWQALRILDAHATGIDLQYAIAGVAELEHVAGQRLDREILVDRADLDRGRLQHHRVVAGVGDGAAGHRRGHACAGASAQGAVHRVAMQPSAPGATAGGETVGQHPHDFGELFAAHLRIRPGACQRCEQRVLVPFACGDFGDDLLCHNVQRRRRHDQCIQFTPAHAIEQGRAFDQFVAGGRENAALGHAADEMPGAAHALQEGSDAAWRSELADQVDITDIDAQLKRGGRHQHLQLAGLQPLLGIQSQLLGKRPVVGCDVLLAEQVGEVLGRAFGHAPGVDEDERGAMLFDQLRDALVHLLPLLVAHHRGERRGRHLDGEIARPIVADVDDVAVGASGVVDMSRADQETRDCIDRLLRRRQADALQRLARQRFQAFQRQGEMAAAFALHQRVDLVDDHRLDPGQHRPPGFGAQQHIQRFRRGDQDVGRALAQGGALGLWRIAGAHRGADLDIGQAEPGQFFADAGQRCFQVDVDVVRQRLERRDVQHLSAVREAVRQSLAHQCVDRGEEGGQRLAGAGRRGDQHVFAGGDPRPRGILRRGRRGEATGEPAGHRGMEAGKCGGQGHGWIIRAAVGRGLNAWGVAEIEAELRGHRGRVVAMRLTE